MDMPFGRHKAKALSEIPLDYLEWLLTIDLRPRLRKAVEREVAHREGRPEPTPSPAPDKQKMVALIRRWHRECVLQLHPDRGGDIRTMQIFNSAYDRLRKLLEI
jgi:hypothetical protein